MGVVFLCFLLFSFLYLYWYSSKGVSQKTDYFGCLLTPCAGTGEVRINKHLTSAALIGQGIPVPGYGHKPQGTRGSNLSGWFSSLCGGLCRFLACKTPIHTTINVTPANCRTNKTAPYTSHGSTIYTANNANIGSQDTQCRWVICSMSELFAPLRAHPMAMNAHKPTVSRG